LQERSSLRRFLVVRRKFGIAVAFNVTLSKLRGKLWPHLALPDAPILDLTPHELTVLLSTAGQTPQTVDTLVRILAERGGSGWDLCIADRSPASPAMAHTLDSCRGKHPWLRIVTTDQTIDDITAARWTVEQATGQFVALLEPGYTPDANVLIKLLASLHDDSCKDAAALIAGIPTSPVPWTACRLLLLRKSAYLASCAGRWPLTVPALAGHLEQTNLPTKYLIETSGEPKRMDQRQSV
jgi:hypothetical protein